MSAHFQTHTSFKLLPCSHCTFTLFSSRVDQEMHNKREMGGTEWHLKRKWAVEENEVEGFFCLVFWVSLSQLEKKKKKACSFQDSVVCYTEGRFIVLVCQTRVEISMLCFKYFYNRTDINLESVVILVNSCCFSLMFKTSGFQARWCMFYITFKIFIFKWWSRRKD